MLARAPAAFVAWKRTNESRWTRACISAIASSNIVALTSFAWCSGLAMSRGRMSSNAAPLSIKVSRIVSASSISSRSSIVSIASNSAAAALHLVASTTKSMFSSVFSRSIKLSSCA